MHKYIIERDIPEIGSAAREELRAAAKKSNEVLREMGPGIQWVESYVADNKVFCVYFADTEDLVHKRAEASGFPANKVTEISTVYDPSTEHAT